MVEILNTCSERNGCFPSSKLRYKGKLPASITCNLENMRVFKYLWFTYYLIFNSFILLTET